MAMVESTLSSVLKKHEQSPYSDPSKTIYTFYIQLPTSQKILKCQLELEPLTIVQEAILLAIEDFNHQLQEQKMELVKQIEFYVPRLPKKNGKAKTDMPCLDINQKLQNIKITSISIQIKEVQKAFINRKIDIDDLKSKRSETKSTIMIQMTNSQRSKKYSQQIQDHDDLVKSQRKNQCFCSFC